MATTWLGYYWANLKAVIEGAWPEIAAGNLFQDNTLERTDWINDLNDNQIQTVWAVAKIAFEQTMDWGMGPAPKWKVDTKINYVAPLSSAPTGETITEYIAGKLMALQAALQAGAGLGSVLPEMPVTINSDDDLNIPLLDAKLGFQSGSLTVSSIVVPGL